MVKSLRTGHLAIPFHRKREMDPSGLELMGRFLIATFQPFIGEKFVKFLVAMTHDSAHDELNILQT